MDKKLTYSTYLKVGDLIGLQKPLAEPPVHDEMLFIVVHQAYELWFKLVLFEMDSLVEHLGRDHLLAASRLLDRICEVMRVLIQQIDVLETMTPVDFNRFRSKLNPASGFQSFQFRELELYSGADPKEYERFFELEPEWKSRLQARAKQQNLRSAFFGVLRREGLLQGDDPAEIQKAILTVYHEEEAHLELQNLCEHLIRYDEQFSLWRYRHVQMVERMIGMKIGTGSSLGVKYLQTTLRKRFFEELWQARTAMNGGGYGND